MSKLKAVLAAVCLLAPGLAVAAERLVVEPYPSDRPWTLATERRAGVKFLREWIPADQKIETYRDILTAQAFPESKHVAPGQFLKLIFSGIGGQCEGPRVNGPVERREQGFAVAYGQAYCGRQIGKPFGVFMHFKVIQGADALYVVQREFRVPPSAVGGTLTFGKGQEKEAQAFMAGQSQASDFLTGQVYLCADRSVDPRCAKAP